MSDYGAALGTILDGMGQLTAAGWELAIDRSPESSSATWRLQLRKPGAKTLVVDDEHSLNVALEKLVRKYERATGLKAAK